MKEIKQIIPLVLSIMLLTSCLNPIERSLIGDYKVLQLETTDSSLLKSLNLSLKVKRNKEFILQKNDILFTGNWKAGDNGDITWIYLYINKEEIQCRVLGQKNEIIEFLNSLYLFDERIKKLSFEREK